MATSWPSATSTTTRSTKPTKSFPDAAKYNDFRKMLDEVGKNIDAVTVSTPDHMHAPASAMAMRMGKACFTQKPLTRTIYEARKLGEIARENESRHADGQPGHGQQLAAQDRRGRPQRRRRQGQGSARLDQPPDLAAGRRSPGRSPRAAERPLGPVDRPARRCGPTPTAITRSRGAAAGISAPAPWATWPATRSTCRSWPSTSAIPTAVQATTSGHNKDSYPQVVDHHVRLPGQRRSSGREDGLVRWRQEARRCAVRRPGSQRHRRAADRRQGQAVRPRRLLREGLQAAQRRQRRRYRRLVRSCPRATSANLPTPSRAARRPARTSPTTPARLPRRSCWATWPCGPRRAGQARARRSSGTPRTSRRPTRPRSNWSSRQFIATATSSN